MIIFQVIDALVILVSLLGAISSSVSLHYICRVGLGIAVGLNSILIPTNLVSCLPKSMTLANLFHQLGIVTGIFIGFLFAWFWSEDALSWSFIVFFPAIPSILRILAIRNTYPYISTYSAIQPSNK